MRYLEDRYYQLLPTGPVAQGDVWLGLPGEPLLAQSVAGLVITPRCDLAHGKAKVLNYLPIIPLDDILPFVGGIDLLQGELSNTVQTLRNLADKLGVVELFEVGELGEILHAAISTQIEAASTDKSRKNLEMQKEKFSKTLIRADALREAIEASMSTSDTVRQFVPEQALLKFRKDAARNRISDLHFLPPYTDLIPRPAVASLRCVMACSANLLDKALETLGDATWSRQVESRLAPFATFVANRPERALRLKSPHIESLMARFCSLFGRVGTRDLTEDEITHLTKPGRY
jgi:hypothetical protein